MVILLISPWKDDWDMERVVGYTEPGALIKGLLDKGVKIHLLIPGKKGFTNSPYPNLIIHPISIYKPLKIKFFSIIVFFIEYLILNLSFAIHGSKICKKYSIDTIYGISSIPGLAVYWLGKIFNKPTILKLLGVFAPFHLIKKHNPIQWLRNFSEIIVYKLGFDKLFILDDGTQGDKLADYFKVPKQRLLFYPQLIDKAFERESPKGLKELIGFEENNYVILFVARLVFYKGVNLALQAMKLIAQKEPKARFLIVGDGAKREEYEKLAKKLGIWEYTKFIGSVRYLDVWKFYTIADVFLSTNLLSNLCLPVIEAMVAGIPVVTIDTRNTYKLIKNKETGLLVKFKGEESKDTQEEIAEAVCLLLRDKNFKRKITNKAKEFVIKNHPDWNEQIDTEIKLINSLIKK